MESQPVTTSKSALDAWKEIGAFKLQKYLKEGRLTFDPKYQIKEVNTRHGPYIGQVDETDKPYGIGRLVGYGNAIHEGFFVDSSQPYVGIGRACYAENYLGNFLIMEYEKGSWTGIGLD